MLKDDPPKWTQAHSKVTTKWLQSKDAHYKAKTQRLQNPNTKAPKLQSFKPYALILNREPMIPWNTPWHPWEPKVPYDVYGLKDTYLNYILTQISSFLSQHLDQ
jgi:hypothetical protein